MGTALVHRFPVRRVHFSFIFSPFFGYALGVTTENTYQRNSDTGTVCERQQLCKSVFICGSPRNSKDDPAFND